MGASNSENKGLNFFSLKAKTSDSDPTPFIGKLEKGGNGWSIGEKFNSFDGVLVDIEHESYEWEGQTKHQVKFKFRDPDGTLNLLSSNFNSLVYSLLNSLSSAPPNGKIKIEIWLGKAQIVNGIAGKRWPQLALKDDKGQRISWKWEPAELPKPKKEKYKGQVITDDSKVIEFWTKAVGDIKEVLAANPSHPVATAEKKAVSLNGNEDPEMFPSDDDLPF